MSIAALLQDRQESAVGWPVGCCLLTVELFTVSCFSETLSFYVLVLKKKIGTGTSRDNFMIVRSNLESQGRWGDGSSSFSGVYPGRVSPKIQATESGGVLRS